MVEMPAHGHINRYQTYKCRCDECKAGARAYRHARAKHRAYAKELADCYDGKGKNFVAVCAQLNAMPSAAQSPGLCELARTIARDLDRRELGGQHASLARQLRETFQALADAAPARTARLGSVTLLSERKKAAS
jgi:hypothetical protein